MCPPSSWCEDWTTKEFNIINGEQITFYDRPIALLSGPGAVSEGDEFFIRMKFHPMTRTFGKPSAGAHSGIEWENSCNTWETSLNGNFNWELCWTHVNGYMVDNPGVYLVHEVIPVDEEVWLTREDVAKGEDTVVKHAMEWIQNLTYAHDVAVDKTYAVPESEQVVIRTIVDNHNEHEISVEAVIRNADSTVTDNLTLYDDGDHGDGEPGDNHWGNFYSPTGEQFFKVSVTTNDITEGIVRTLPNVAWFTTAGPVEWKDYSIEQYNDSLFALKATLENKSTVSTISNVTARLSSKDNNVTRILRNPQTYPDIEPGQSVEGDDIYGFAFYAKNNPENIQFEIEINSGGFHFWSDSLQIVTDILISEEVLPVEFAMQQNYPNPFNPNTVINYQLPMISDVELSVYNLLGQKVATLVNDKKQAGYHQVEWNASGFASGIFYYRIQTGEFQDVKKMILIK
jgi:hypothetical protein